MSRNDTPMVLVQKLVHDVGKYICRAARNFDDTPLTDPLHALFLEDLYALDGARTAAQVFEEPAATLEAAIGPNPHLATCREMLHRIDVLESAVRSNDGPAVQEAARLAIEIDKTLRLLSKEMKPKDDK